MGRFVKPERVRLPLSDGDYIDCKKRLNTGEQQALFARMAPTMTAGEKATLNTTEVLTSKVLAYLIGWSLTDNGVPVPMSPDLPESERLSAIHNLDPETFKEIREAIDWHEEAVEQEIADLKKTKDGGSTLKLA